MALFTSDRERKLWLWVLVVLVAIYSSLGAVGTFVAWLRERNLLRLTVTLVLVLVVGVIVFQWVRQRPTLGEIGIGLGITAVYTYTWFRLPIPEERTHLIEYGMVAILIFEALKERRRNGRHTPAAALIAIVSTALLGFIDEGIQSVLPNRFYDIRDVGFNTLAGLMAVGSSFIVTKARNWVNQKNAS